KVEDAKRRAVDLCSRSEYVADETLAGLVRRMRLAGEDDLQAADFAGDLFETRNLLKQQRNALVGRHAAGEAERKDVGIKLNAGALLDRLKQPQFAQLMGLGDLLRRDAVHGAEVLVIVTPLRNFLVQKLLKRLREPGRSVDPVGDGVDAVLRKHQLRHLAVLHGNAVDVAREAKRDIRHVHQAVV